MANVKRSLVPSLSNLISVRIDKDYPYLKYWDSPLKTELITVFMNNLDEGFQETCPVKYADIDVIGRTEVFKNYIGNSNREIALLFQFQVQGIHYGLERADSLDVEVVQPAKWLDALKFPIIADDGISHAPPPVLLTLGSLLQMRCVATDVSIHWKPPFDPDTLLPYAADVSVTFCAVSKVMGNYNFRGPLRFTGDASKIAAERFKGSGAINSTLP